jgi:catechol 2,3-dioxygenase-like lactoylglutathione lyase family enzyme
VLGVDHVVLIVADPERSIHWYAEVLGLVGERVDEWRAGAAPFPSMRVSDSFVIDLLPGEPDGRNVDHVCLVVEGLDLEALAASELVEVVGGPAQLWGARGMGAGLYVADPDGHTLELRTYP